MKPSYLIALRPEGPGGAGLTEDLHVRTGLPVRFNHPRAAVLASPDCPVLPLAGEGAILGALFHRHGPARRIDALAPDEAAGLLEGRGARLLKSCWGGYVALLCGPGPPRVLRDPSGALPCYVARLGPAPLFASDAALLCTAARLRPVVDWPALARHLHANGLPVAETALEGVGELLAGFARDGDETAPCWSPWNHVASALPPDPVQLAERLARCVTACVGAWTAPFPRLLLSVSGGLDSSIVAACLAGTTHEIRCLTMYSDDPRGDERPYARALCAALGLSLRETRYDRGDVDIAEPLNAHLPRPVGRTQALAYERAHLVAARAYGIDAFVTGHGGDNVFAHSQSASPIVDRYLREGLGTGLFHTLVDTCRLTGCGPLDAARRALHLRRRWPRPYRWHVSPDLLHPDLLAGLGATRPGHPWLAPPPGALPGQLAHIAGLLRSQQSLEPMRAARAPVLHPLLSQPVVELCLAIPSWAWRAGGIDRAVARRAFAGRLPDAIVSRRVKGGPDGFSAALIHACRAPIRERLLGGRLAAQSLVDRAALEAVLAEERPMPEDAPVRLQELLVAEAWLDHWLSRDLAS
ncbi:asparagine synthase-related protein [Sphingosinicella sp. LHD-64]|uniref:asparagine synthase-related protein n=1 Tax=Sphingosinicella sp. LHD-64 TaxID=3072139 RepID=UPI00280FAE53|nr:asparagine synthase-related protein [Sphingosinicella sp. LHD-64]MDQ8757406.1 asparagine synthase-related protein [Sphingosinicella sp. LHD-64]